MGKRGISPLIGAILIIAFTIAIAAVVMFWSAGFIKSTTETATVQTTKEVTCSMEVNLKINSACLEGNSLKYVIDNKGKQDLSGFITRVYAADGVIANETNVTIPSLNVMLFRQYVDSSLLGSISKIEVVPVITMSNGNKATCKDTVIKYKNIKTCTSESYLLYCKFDNTLTCEDGETANSSGLSYTAKSIIDTSQSNFAQGVYYNLDITSESGNVLLSRPVSDSNTVLLLYFDGNSTKDYSNYGNNGTLGGGNSGYAPQYTASGKISGAYTFDGSNDYVQQPLNGAWFGSNINQITVEMWLKPDNISGNRNFFGAHNPSGQRIYFAIYNNKWDMGIGSNSWGTGHSGTLADATTDWTHIAVTFNSGTATMYVNGQTTITKPYTTISTTGEMPTGIMNEGGSMKFAFSGVIDELRILNKALTPAEIYHDYQDQSAGKQLTVTDYEGKGNLTSKIFDLGSNPTISSLSWNEEKSWRYKKPITITNTEAAPLTNHQVLITLTTSNFNYSKANADGSDIRFLKNSVQLNYWVETWNPTGESKIWVKIPYIAPSSSETIYMYYSNPSATKASNGRDTFLFFDDFEDTIWTSNYWSPQRGTWTVESGTYKVVQTSGDGYSIANYTGPNDYIVEVKGKTNNVHSGLVVRASAGSKYYEGETHSPTAIETYRFDNPTTYANLNQTLGTVTKEVWHDLKFTVQGTSLKFELSDISIKTTATDSTYSTGKPGTWTYADTAYFDDFRVRKYVSIEPTISIGSEESITTIQLQTRSGPTNISLGSWSAYYINPQGEFWKSSNERYIQYRTFLETSYTSLTPKVLDITINYTEGSISEGVSFENAVYNQGVYIEGGDTLNYPVTDNLNTDEGTIELWVNMSWGDSSAHYILEDSNSVFELYKDSSNNLIFDLFGIQSTYSTSSLSDFHNIAIIWKANDKIYLYIDGIERDSDSIASIPTIGENLYIGSDSSGSNQLNGVIDELIVSEIKKEFN